MDLYFEGITKVRIFKRHIEVRKKCDKTVPTFKVV